MKAALLLLGLVLGCAEQVPTPPVKVDAGAPQRWATSLGRIARQHADAPLGVDFEALAAEPEALQAFQAWLARRGPESDPMRESAEDTRLAFLLNAHNALVLAGVLHLGQPARLDAPASRQLLRGLAWRVDDEWITLDLLKQERIRGRFQEPLVHLALYDATRDSPPLRWWGAESLQGSLKRAASRFLASDRGLRAVGDGYQANPLFFRYQKDFLEWGEAENLCRWMLPYAQGERESWLRANAMNCPLTPFAADPSLDAVRRGEGDDTPADEPPSDAPPPSSTGSTLDD